MASLRERRLGRQPSAQQILSGSSAAAPANTGVSTGSMAGPSGLGAGSGSDVGSGPALLIGGLSLKSPLTQVKAMGSALPSSRHQPESHTELDLDLPIPSGIPSSTHHSALGTASTVPAPNFNLFRSASVYSIASDASDLTFLSDTDTDEVSAASSSPPLAPFSGLNLGEISGLSTPRAETPTTPRGVKPGQGYFDAWSAPVQAQPPGPVSAAQQGHYGAFGQQAVAGPSRIPALTSLPPRVDSRRIVEKELGAERAYERTSDRDEEGDGQATPKKGFVVRSRPAAPIEPMPPLIPSRQGSMSEYDHEPLTATAPPTGRSLAETHASVAKLVAGVAPDAHAGTVTAHLPTRQSMSGEDWESIHGEQGSEWGDEASDESASRTGSVYLDARGADYGAGAGSPMEQQRDTLGPPSSTDESGESQRPTAWLVSQPSAQSTALQATQGSQASRKTKRNIIIPRRAAPPPPPGPGTPQNAQDAFTGGSTSTSAYAPASRIDKRPSADTLNSNFSTAASTSSSGGNTSGSVASTLTNASRQALQPRWANETDTSTSYGYGLNGVFDPARLPEVGSNKVDKGKGVAGRSGANLQIHADRDEYYARPDSASSGDARYLNGHGDGVVNGRSSALPTSDTRYTSNGVRTPSMDSLRSGAGANASGDLLLSKGLEARARDDLAKAAWCFKQSADAGNSTGRMYWGLALKHGWGVARDDTKAFKELQQACDDALAEQGMGEGKDRRDSIVQPGPRKAMSKELSMGIAEMANCFLNGTGVKKSPEAAMSYLRFAADMGDIAAQEQLGFLFSKGAQGVKKDMHEAARWYRMAIDQGSSNTFGLAWVWKDKYNS